MKKNDKQLNFRINEDLMDWLKNYAKESRRSITAQLSLIIEQEKNRVTQQQQSNFKQ